VFDDLNVAVRIDLAMPRREEFQEINAFVPVSPGPQRAHKASSKAAAAAKVSRAGRSPWRSECRMFGANESRRACRINSGFEKPLFRFCLFRFTIYDFTIYALRQSQRP